MNEKNKATKTTTTSRMKSGEWRVERGRKKITSISAALNELYFNNAQIFRNGVNV